MEATTFEAADLTAAEVAGNEKAKVDSIGMLTTTEMSFVGGGLLVVAFA
jgi:hypothetical protein